MESRLEDNKQGNGQRPEGVGGFRGNDQACLSSGRTVLVGTERKSGRSEVFLKMLISDKSPRLAEVWIQRHFIDWVSR